jgi:hypothetical protein
MTNSAPADESDATGPPVVARILLCVSVTICGLALRRCGSGLGLPAFFVKYGGSMLWGAMMFFLVAIAAPRLTRRNVASIAAVVAVCVELFRLVHSPWLDAFRLTLAVALLLGRIFSARTSSPMASGSSLNRARSSGGRNKRNATPYSAS